MFHLWQELWDTEEEEEEGSFPEDSSSTEPEDSCSEHFQERHRGCQDPPVHHPLQRCPRECRCCRRRLFAPYDLQGRVHSLHSTGCLRGSGVVAQLWGRGSLPWDPPLGSWVQDTGAVGQSPWQRQQAAASSSSRTLSHPSFQTYFTAVSACSSSCPPSPGGQMVPQSHGGPLPLVEGSSFFYTDPTMPPGYRIYNCLSASSQEGLHRLRLNTPAPVMCPGPVASPGCRWLSDLECRAVSALLALPASTRSAASPRPVPGAAERGEAGALAPCQ